MLEKITICIKQSVIIIMMMMIKHKEGAREKRTFRSLMLMGWLMVCWGVLPPGKIPFPTQRS